MAQISIRIDDDLKNNMEQVCKEMGMSMTTAFTIFATKVSRERKIPFEISAEPDPFYSESNMLRLRNSIAQMNATGGTVHELIEVDDHE